MKEKYGLKKIGGMKEIWREKSALRRHRNQAMKLIGRVDTTEGHFAREKTDMINSLCRKGLLVEGASLDDVLQINVEHMLSRRLISLIVLAVELGFVTWLSLSNEEELIKD